MEGTKRIIMVKGNDAQWFDEVIFVMDSEKNRTQVPMNLAHEAERIINEYMMKNNFRLQTSVQEGLVNGNVKKTNKEFLTIDRILNLCIMLSCILLVLTLFSLLM